MYQKLSNKIYFNLEYCITLKFENLKCNNISDKTAKTMKLFKVKNYNNNLYYANIININHYNSLN